MKRAVAWPSLLCVAAFSGCYRPPKVIAPIAMGPLHPSVVAAMDAAPKEEPRMLPAEAYVRTYLQLFGGLAPLEVQRRARAGDGNQLFDTWGDYLATLGFPDYRLDLPRAQETNALMVATFERMGDALCDRAVEYDLKGVLPPSAPPPLSPLGTLQPPPPGDPMKDDVYGPLPPPPPEEKPVPKPPAPKPALVPPPIERRVIYAFEVPSKPIDLIQFTPRFDVLHRTFLGYPAKLAPPDRVQNFFTLYQDTLARHAEKDAPKSRFTPTEAAWATVCYALVRHPEFHFY